MKLRSAVLALSMCSVFGLTACGSDSESSEAREERSTPAQALAEIGATRDGLDEAVAQLRAGDRKAAENTVAETYLRHFEHVEGPLEKVDHELNEELEEAISGELRKKIHDGTSPSEVQALVREVKSDLATAESKLR